MHWKTWKELEEKKEKREDTVSRFSRSRGTTRLGCVLVHTEEGLVRDNGHATMTSQTDNSLLFVHTEQFVALFFFFPFTLVGMYYASDEFILGYDKPNTTWTGPTA